MRDAARAGARSVRFLGDRWIWVYVEPLALAGAARVIVEGSRGDYVWFRAGSLVGLDETEYPVDSIRVQVTRLHHIEGIRLFDVPELVSIFSCVAGRAAFVAVDLRRGSKTFGRWVPQELDARRPGAVRVAGGLAFGWQALTAEAVVVGVHNQPGAPGEQLSVDPLDPQLAIQWPAEPASPVAGLTVKQAIDRGLLPPAPGGDPV